MMNELRIFDNPEFGQVRTMMIDGEAWFVGKDIAQALGYSDTADALKKHVDGEDKQHFNSGDLPTLKMSNYGAYFIKESGLYSLILSSKLPNAKKFKRWVTSEVLPAIRKTGAYAVPMTTADKLRLLVECNSDLSNRMDAVENSVGEVKDEFRSFRDDLPLLGAEMDQITSAVKRKGVEVLGGKESDAYHDSSLRGKVYADIYQQIKREFGVPSYKQIKRGKVDVALQIVAKYAPPYVLANDIANMNAQMRMAM